MRVDAGFSFHRYGQPARGDAGETRDAATFLAALDETAPGKAKIARIEQADFTNMTRQALFDWMNGQIRSGDMSLDDSSAFLGMTVKISAATGQPVDMASDTTRIDFTEKARQGIAFALSRFDHAAAEKLQAALDLMEQAQGRITRFDARI